MAESALRGLGYVLRGLLPGQPGNVVITSHGVVRAAPEHLVDRHARAFALYVPERLVHGGDHLVVDRSTAPVGAEVGALPQVLDTVRILTDKPWFEVLFERSRHGISLKAVVGRPNAVEARFTGDDLQEGPPVATPAVGHDDLGILDGQRGEPFQTAVVLIGRQRGHCRRGQQCLEKIPALHVLSFLAPEFAWLRFSRALV